MSQRIACENGVQLIHQKDLRLSVSPAHARSHEFLESVDYVDYELLRTLRSAAQHLEVKVCSSRSACS